MKYVCTGAGGRGCGCEYHTWRRGYARDHARQRREAKLAATRMTHRTCPKRFGRNGVCGAVLVSETRNGELVVRCPGCERFARGICRDCPRPVDGQARRARRCRACKAKALCAMQKKYVANNPELVLRRAREYGRKHHDRRAAYKRLWRAANPEKVRTQKERSRGERRAAYMKEYRERHRVRLANAARDRQQGAQPLRTCVACRRIVVTHRKKKCTRCKEAARQSALTVLTGQRARGAA